MQSLYKGDQFQMTWAGLRENCSSGYLKKNWSRSSSTIRKTKESKISLNIVYLGVSVIVVRYLLLNTQVKLLLDTQVKCLYIDCYTN